MGGQGAISMLSDQMILEIWKSLELWGLGAARES